MFYIQFVDLFLCRRRKCTRNTSRSSFKMKKKRCLMIFAFVLFGSINAQSPMVDECTTPKKKSGVCIQLMSCSPLLKILDRKIKTKSIEDHNYLLKSHCGFYGRATKVCCPLEDTSPDPTENEKVVDRVKDEASSRPILKSEEVCTTPKKEIGVCIKLTDCEAILNVLDYKEQKSPFEIYNFLKESHSGLNKRAAFVCCPLENTTESTVSIERFTHDLTDSEVNELIEQIFGNETSSELLSQTSCGKSGINHVNIVDSHQAELGSWPWIAALRYRHKRGFDYIIDNNRQWLCAGTLITDRHVLTAAQCVLHGDSKFKLFAVRLGKLDLGPDVGDGAEPLDILIERIAIHSEYNSSTSFNNIAMLKLKEVISLNIFI